MGIYVVIEQATGIIDNRIVLDDPAQWEPPAGHVLVEETGEPMAIGGTYIDGVYTPPPEPEPVPEPPLPPQADPQTTVLYDHENRIRAQEGAPPLSLAEFLIKAAPT
jgi:hypothetical protein